MKYQLGCFIIITLALVACAFSKKSMPGYQLVWADEFNKNGKPDTCSWRYEHGFVRNEEDQWYQEDNAYCMDGLLVIEARREALPNPRFSKDGKDWRTKRDSIHYTSSSINTSRKHSWQYGRFIMRGRIDISAGIWPAWWTLGVQGNWPANGEIDIMEYYKRKLLANIACADANHKALWYSNTFPIDSLGGEKWASQFHIWRMDWDENAISLYLDDVLLNQVKLDQLFNRDGSKVIPFRQPHYMLLNLAIGGMNGGDPSATRFPKKFEVDYVRVYQRK